MVIIIGLWIRLPQVNNVKTVLAADIGGTKTLFQLMTADGQILLQTRYENSEFANFEALLELFLTTLCAEHLPIDVACFAVAGPIEGQQAQVTNLPWLLDGQQLTQLYPLTKIILVNDFAAVGYGIATLQSKDIIVLQAGQVDTTAPRAVIGAGTGLGQAFMTPEAGSWHVWSTEGGHTDFAPTTQLQQLILQEMLTQWSHVSYERLISGMGLVWLYDFFCRQAGQLNTIQNDPEAAQRISEWAHQQDPVALQTLHMFTELYGAQAGNVALTLMPKGGLYLAGGIAMKNCHFFEEGRFMQAFLAKGRMQPLLNSIPVFLIKSPTIGLSGAAWIATKALSSPV